MNDRYDMVEFYVKKLQELVQNEDNAFDEDFIKTCHKKLSEHILGQIEAFRKQDGV